MYSQILYQIEDKLTSTLQNNNKIDPVEGLIMSAIAIGVIIGSAYMIRKELKEVKKMCEMKKYKST